MLYLAGVKISTKTALVASTIAIVSLARILDLALEDWFLWAFLLFLITVDTVAGVTLAVVRHKFDWKRLHGYFRKIFAYVGGMMALSLFATAFSERPAAGPMTAIIRDFVGIGLMIYMMGRTALKFGSEGKVFLRFLRRAISKAGE